MAQERIIIVGQGIVSSGTAIESGILVQRHVEDAEEHMFMEMDRATVMEQRGLQPDPEAVALRALAWESFAAWGNKISPTVGLDLRAGSIGGQVRDRAIVSADRAAREVAIQNGPRIPGGQGNGLVRGR